MGNTLASLRRIASWVNAATAANILGRAGNLLVPFIVLGLHESGRETDSFFIGFAVAFYFFGTLSNSVCDALVPRLASAPFNFTHARWALISAFAAILSLTTTAALSQIGNGTISLVEITSFAVMAGAGVYASPAIAALHLQNRYALPNLLWLTRLVPLAAYSSISTSQTPLYLLALGLAVADVIRAWILMNRARLRLFTTSGSNRDGREARNIVPIMAASIIAGLNPLIDRWIAALGEPGAITTLEAAERVYQAIASVATIGVTSVLLVYLSRAHQHQRLETSWSRALAAAFPWAAFWLATALGVGWLVFPNEILPLFNLGADATDTATSTYLAYAWGLPALIYGLFVVRRYVVEGRLRQLLMFAVLSVLLNAILSWVGFNLLGITGIAIATTAVYTMVTTGMIAALWVRPGATVQHNP